MTKFNEVQNQAPALRETIEAIWRLWATAREKALSRINNCLFLLNAGALVAALTYVASKDASHGIYSAIWLFVIGISCSALHAGFDYYAIEYCFSKYRADARSVFAGKLDVEELFLRNEKRPKPALDIFLHCMGWFSAIAFAAGLVIGVQEIPNGNSKERKEAAMVKANEIIKTPGAGEWGASADSAVTSESPEQRLHQIRAEKEAALLRLQVLEQQERELAQAERSKKIETLATSIHDAGIDLNDIAAFFAKKGWPTTLNAKQPAAKKTPAPAKYKNPETGETHSGRGVLPQWLRNAKKAGKLEDYAIN